MARVDSAVDKRDSHAFAAAHPQRLDIEVRRGIRLSRRTRSLGLRLLRLGWTGPVGPALTGAGLSARQRTHPTLVFARVAARCGRTIRSSTQLVPKTDLSQ